ncbi:MAG TPA: response regulator [Candidatus Treponema faecavium]|nr:response regulator [Candidatus Treponema faecavium]
MSKTNTKPVVYSALEVANICGVVNQTAINWIRSGYLKAYSTPGGQYRVYADDLADFMQSRNMRLPQELIDICGTETNRRIIVIVDDDKGLNAVIKSFFEKKFPKAEILQAFDGFEAGALMAEHKPHCVILDIHLPGVNGVELCNRINATSDFGKPVIIGITAMPEEYTAEEIKKMGTKHFFAKPLNLEELAKTVSQALNIPMAE